MSVLGATDVLISGELLNVDEKAILSVFRAVFVVTVIILTVILYDSGECDTIDGNLTFLFM